MKIKCELYSLKIELHNKVIKRDNVFPDSLWYPMYREKCDTVKVDYFPIFFYLFLSVR